jgi:hypothetical protein
MSHATVCVSVHRWAWSQLEIHDRPKTASAGRKERIKIIILTSAGRKERIKIIKLTSVSDFA